MALWVHRKERQTLQTPGSLKLVRQLASSAGGAHRRSRGGREQEQTAGQTCAWPSRPYPPSSQTWMQAVEMEGVGRKGLRRAWCESNADRQQNCLRTVHSGGKACKQG